MEQFSQMIATALKLPVHRVENTLKLLQGGATIPFISRYRKEATGGLDEVQIGDIHTRYEKLCELAKRKETVLSTIEEQGKLTLYENAFPIVGMRQNWKIFTCLLSPNEKLVPRLHARRDWNRLPCYY